MNDTLSDIRAKFQQGIYRNEEHIRLSLVVPGTGTVFSMTPESDLSPDVLLPGTRWRQARSPGRRSPAAEQQP